VNCRICESSNLWTQVAVFSRKPCLPEGCLNTNWGLCLFKWQKKKWRNLFFRFFFLDFEETPLKCKTPIKEDSLMKNSFWLFEITSCKFSSNQIEGTFRKVPTFFKSIWKGKRKKKDFFLLKKKKIISSGQSLFVSQGRNKKHQK